MKKGLEQPILEQQTSKHSDYEHLSSIVINVCWASAYSGYCVGYFNSINFDDTMKIFAITADRALMQGSLSFCIAAGAAFGGFYAKQILSRFSRRDSFIFVAIIACIFTVLLQTKILFLLFISRIVQGITVGASSVLRSTYIKQFVPLQLSGKFGTLNQVFFAIGLIFTFVITYVLSLFMTAENYWRIIYVFPIFFTGLQIFNFLYRFPYQTPKYLLEINRKKEAKELISIIYKPQYVEQRLNQLQKHINISAVKKDQEMTEFGQGLFVQTQNQQKKLTSNKLATIVAYTTLSLQQLSGIQVIILYAGQIMLSINPNFQKVIPLFLQIQGLISTLFAMKLIGTHGRKQLMQLGLLTMGITHFIMAFCFLLEYMNGELHPTASLVENIIIIFGLFGCRWIFSMTLGPIAWLYLPEVVQPEKTGIAAMLNWICAALVALIYPMIVQLVGSPYLIFAIFGIIMISGYEFNKKWMVQTKDKPQWKIRQEYDQLLQHF